MAQTERVIEGCNATGVCARCQGHGAHQRETFEDAECEVCDGTGDCPCVHNMRAHAPPVA